MGCTTSQPDKNEVDKLAKLPESVYFQEIQYVRFDVRAKENAALDTQQAATVAANKLPESVYFEETQYIRFDVTPKGEPALDTQPLDTFAADVCLTDKFAEWKNEESSAAELFTSCLSVVLPIVKEEVGKQLIQLNESGGLEVAGGYTLKVVPRTGDAKRKLTPDELIKTLHVEIKTCRVRTKDEITTLNADDDDPTNDETVANRLLNLDLKLMVVIEFGQDNVDFKLEGGGWFSPSVEMALESLKLELYARVWWDMARRVLMVGFVEEPIVEWDLELNAMGFGLPDAIEDDMLTFAIRKGLGIFSIDNPLKIDLSPKEETPSASDVASLHVVTSLSPTMRPVLYDEATRVLAQLGPIAEPAEAKPAETNPLVNRKAAIKFDSLPVVDSLGPTMRLIFFDEATGELVQLGPPSQQRGPVEAEVNFAPPKTGGTAKTRNKQASFSKRLEREEAQKAMEAKLELAGPEEVEAATKMQAILRGKQARADAKDAGQNSRTRLSWAQWLRGEQSAEKI